MTSRTVPAAAIDCQSCGACCAYSRDWPRFTTEDDATLDRIPAQYVNDSQTGMRCNENRCKALAGTVGINTSCDAYDVRPEVCRSCNVGDEACEIARAHFNLPSIQVDDAA